MDESQIVVGDWWQTRSNYTVTEDIQQICDLIRDHGLTFETALEFLGLDTNLYRQAFNQGCILHRSISESAGAIDFMTVRDRMDVCTPLEQKQLALYLNVRKARAHKHANLSRVVYEGASRSPELALKVLERERPEEWAAKPAIRGSGDLAKVMEIFKDAIAPKDYAKAVERVGIEVDPQVAEELPQPNYQSEDDFDPVGMTKEELRAIVYGET